MESRQVHTPPETPRRQGRAARLLDRVVTSGAATREALAAALFVTPAALDMYASGREPMPLNLQARLALHLIAQVPEFVHEGNQLRQQVAAAISFETGINR